MALFVAQSDLIHVSIYITDNSYLEPNSSRRPTIVPLHILGLYQLRLWRHE